MVGDIRVKDLEQQVEYLTRRAEAAESRAVSLEQELVRARRRVDAGETIAQRYLDLQVHKRDLTRRFEESEARVAELKVLDSQLRDRVVIAERDRKKAEARVAELEAHLAEERQAARVTHGMVRRLHAMVMGTRG